MAQLWPLGYCSNVAAPVGGMGSNSCLLNCGMLLIMAKDYTGACPFLDK